MDHKKSEQPEAGRSPIEGNEWEVINSECNVYVSGRSTTWADKLRPKHVKDYTKLMELWHGVEEEEKKVMNHKNLYDSRRSKSWVVKHRPKQLDDVKHQAEAVQKLIETIRSNKAHIFLYGKPGIGKTSAVSVVANHVFSCPVLYESSRTPVPTLLTSIKKFVEENSSGHNRCSPSMLILIDEAHRMGENYQKPLMRMLQKAPFRNVRFIFKCVCVGQDNRLIGPLAEVCVSIGFKSLPHNYVESSLQDICVKESLVADAEVISAICCYAKGSLGSAITFLQRAARSFRSEIYADDLAFNADKRILAEEAKRVIDVCQSRQWTSLLNAVYNIIDEELDVPMYLSKLYDVVAKAEDISDIARNQVCDYLVEADERLQLGENFLRVILDVAGTVLIALLEIPEDQVLWRRRIWLEWKGRYPDIDTDDRFHIWALQDGPLKKKRTRTKDMYLIEIPPISYIEKGLAFMWGG